MGKVERIGRSPEASGDVTDEAAVYAARARRLGLPFVSSVDLGEGTRPDAAGIIDGTFAQAAPGDDRAYIAPDEAAMAGALHWLHIHASARGRLRVSTPTAIREALVRAAAPALMRNAVVGLATRHPHLSARRVATLAQIVVAFVIAALLVLIAAVHPFAALAAVNLVGAVFFFGVSALRFVAAGRARRRPRIDDRGPERSGGPLPVYTILVPLHGEAAMVPGLVAAFDGIDWPGIRAHSPQETGRLAA